VSPNEQVEPTRISESATHVDASSGFASEDLASVLVLGTPADGCPLALERKRVACARKCYCAPVSGA
jgi:hypothetical protein